MVEGRCNVINIDDCSGVDNRSCNCSSEYGTMPMSYASSRKSLNHCLQSIESINQSINQAVDQRAVRTVMGSVLLRMRTTPSL